MSAVYFRKSLVSIPLLLAFTLSVCGAIGHSVKSKTYLEHQSDIQDLKNRDVLLEATGFSFEEDHGRPSLINRQIEREISADMISALEGYIHANAEVRRALVDTPERRDLELRGLLANAELSRLKSMQFPM